MTPASSPTGGPDGRQRNFVAFFHEKEGTTAIVRLLDNFQDVDVIRARGYWEPFNRHACGSMPPALLEECLDLIFSRAPVEQVNQAYKRTATRALSRYRSQVSFGFKMRFVTPELPGTYSSDTPDDLQERFAQTMIDVLGRHDVLVLMAVRQDLMRWALSKYHGDGTGRPGHLQFQLASGQLARDQIPRITVDAEVLEEMINKYQAVHVAKRALAERLGAAGIDVAPMRYEDFLADPEAFFGGLLRRLGHEPSAPEVRAVLDRGVRLQRVHGDDLSEFFVNADEVEARFGQRFERWP